MAFLADMLAVLAAMSTRIFFEKKPRHVYILQGTLPRSLRLDAIIAPGTDNNNNRHISRLPQIQGEKKTVSSSPVRCLAHRPR